MVPNSTRCPLRVLEHPRGRHVPSVSAVPGLGLRSHPWVSSLHRVPPLPQRGGASQRASSAQGPALLCGHYKATTNTSSLPVATTQSQTTGVAGTPPPRSSLHPAAGLGPRLAVATLLLSADPVFCGGSSLQCSKQ